MEEPISAEHSELMTLLYTAEQESHDNSGVIKEVASVFSGHADREEETLVPVLGFMKEWFSGSKQVDVSFLKAKANEFRLEVGTMINEHAQILKLFDEMSTGGEKDACLLSNLRKFMKRHSVIEEYYFYPMATYACKIIDGL
ncbi:hypothetical protein Thermo_01968 [Thermoplasmatales archaeon]|nr:hypothetical protein Thermo_01968 [Thermoplasmatales archaeon]